MLRTFVAALLITSAAPVAEGVPRFNIEATCRAAQALGPEDTDPVRGCLTDERAAEGDLQRHWASFNPGNRSTCVQETGVGGYPSYVEVLTCLQMYGAETSSTTLKPRRRGG
jgi:hypothetical protein